MNLLTSQAIMIYIYAKLRYHMPMKPVVTFPDFDKLDLRIGKIVECTHKEGSEKLLRLIVDFGEEGQRKIFSGIAKWYSPEELINKSFVFVLNLEPRKMMDEFSEGMLMAADGERPLPLTTIEPTAPGSKIL